MKAVALRANGVPRANLYGAPDARAKAHQRVLTQAEGRKTAATVRVDCLACVRDWWGERSDVSRRSTVTTRSKVDPPSRPPSIRRHYEASAYHYPGDRLPGWFLNTRHHPALFPPVPGLCSCGWARLCQKPKEIMADFHRLWKSRAATVEKLRVLQR
jgi:hypothetical protein